MCSTIYPRHSGLLCVGKGLKTCASQTRKRHVVSSEDYEPSDGGWFLYFHIPSGNARSFESNLSGLQRRSLTRTWWSTSALPEPYELMHGELNRLPQRDANSLELISLLLKEEIRREVRKSKHEVEILMVQARPKGFQP